MFLRTVYNTIFRRSSAFALSILVGAVFFERAFDQGGTALFESMNKGKLWKDIKDDFEKNDNGGGDDDE
ncbi:cytochrome b-c1 complex subunit 9-like [Saccoglossus kowalevskii]